MNILDFTDYRKTFPLQKLANKDHRDEIELLEFIDNLLIKSGIEEDMVSHELNNEGITNPSLKKIRLYRQRIRINILMELKGGPFAHSKRIVVSYTSPLVYFLSDRISTKYPFKINTTANILCVISKYCRDIHSWNNGSLP